MTVPATALYAALIGFLAIALAVPIFRGRHRAAVGIGTGGDARLEQAIRVHGNLMEWGPLALVLLALFELNGGAAWAVHTAGTALVAGRLLHAWGLGQHRGTSFGRFVGMSLTLLVIAGLAGANIALAL